MGTDQHSGGYRGHRLGELINDILVQLSNLEGTNLLDRLGPTGAPDLSNITLSDPKSILCPVASTIHRENNPEVTGWVATLLSPVVGMSEDDITSLIRHYPDSCKGWVDARIDLTNL